jgi:hypothetical protein
MAHLMPQQMEPLHRRIADLEVFAGFVACARPRQDGSGSQWGEPAAPAGEPEWHHASCLIGQARVGVARK